jgi:hypothetical protein
MKADQVRAWRRDQRREAAEQLGRQKLDRMAAIVERALEAQAKTPVGQGREALLGERWPRAVTA